MNVGGGGVGGGSVYVGGGVGCGVGDGVVVGGGVGGEAVGGDRAEPVQASSIGLTPTNHNDVQPVNCINQKSLRDGEKKPPNTNTRLMLALSSGVAQKLSRAPMMLADVNVEEPSTPIAFPA
jgi:hypothetical protein